MTPPGERDLTLGVVVTNCDTWPLTLRCLDRLAPFRGALEVLVVDDASSSPGPATLPHGARLLANPVRLGLVRSLNRGIRALKTDLIVLFDSDAYPLGDFTGQVRALFASDPQLAIAGFRTVDGEGRPTGCQEGEPVAASLVLGQRLLAFYERLIPPKTGPLCVFTCAMALRRSAFEDLGGFDEEFDWLDLDLDLCMRAHRAGWRVVHDPALAAFHVGSGAPQKTSERVLRHYKNRWRLLRKFGKIRHPALMRAVVVARLAVEWAVLGALGPVLIRNPAARRDKLDGRWRALKYCLQNYR